MSEPQEGALFVYKNGQFVPVKKGNGQHAQQVFAQDIGKVEDKRVAPQIFTEFLDKSVKSSEFRADKEQLSGEMMFSFTGSSIGQPSGQEPQEKAQSYRFLPVSVARVLEPDQ